MKKVILSLVGVLILLGTTLPVADSSPVLAGMGTGGTFQVELVSGYPQNDYTMNAQTWCYNVTVLATQGDLSHWILDLCDNPGHEVLAWSGPAKEIDDYDPNWDRGNVIKWDATTLKPRDSAIFCFTLDGMWASTQVEWYAKNGAHWWDTGWITGPSCAPPCVPPTANFSANVTSGCTPLTVQFTDSSAGDTVKWKWSFPGGSPSSARTKGPHDVTYDVPGIYTVSLHVINDCGCDTKTMDITVEDCGVGPARILLTPSEDTNVIGDPHEFTVTVETYNGTSWSPYEGATVAFQLTDGPGSLDPLTDVTDADGEAKTILSSNVTGTTTVTASTTVHGFDLSTDGSAQNSDPAKKDWVDARISIDPPEDTNVIGDPHEFTVTVETYNGTSWSPYQGATVAFELTDGPGSLDPGSALTDVNGEAKTTLTSAETGTSTVKASTSIYGYDLSTDGEAPNSDPAEKDWVYARIKIDPLEDTNLIGDPHEFTATVEIYDGDYWLPFAGANVTFEVTDGPGTLDPPTDVTDVDGEAKTILSSNVTGISTVTASTTVNDFNISTDGTAGSSEPANKDWVYARIKIDPPEDTNVVGDPHEFTATVEIYDGDYWLPFAGANVTFEVTSGPGTLDPESALTNSSGQAKTILSSNVTGTSTVTASTTVNGFNISTDGATNNSEPANKDWVYAQIKIEPIEDINAVGDPHEFTATVETSPDGIDWDPYAGATVTFEVTDGPGTLDPLTDVTDADGEAKTILSSTETGTTTVEASTTVYGHDICTDGETYNSDPAEKDWVDARISIVESGVNPVGQPHDFTVTVEEYLGEGTGWVPAAGVNVTFTYSGVGSITSTGPYTTDGSGQVTVTVNSDVAGTATVHASTTVSICDIDIAVATDGYGAYEVGNTKRWTTPPTPPTGGGCPSTKYLTVDWEGENTTEPLYSNDKLAVNLLGPSPDAIHNLFLERGTHAPVVGRHTYYLIVIRELEDIPDLPDNTTALMAFNITPSGSAFNKDIFLTLGIDEVPENALNVTMAYYDDVEGAWVLLDSEAGGPSGVAELTLSTPINHFSIFGVLAELEPTPPPAPASFVGSGLSIEPSVEKNIFVTRTGESVTISATITNDGGQEGTYTVALKLNGETVDTETVLLSAGLSAQVSFTVSDLDYGQYEVEVAGLNGEFTASRTITWWLIVVIIVGIGLIIWGVVWARRRRRARQLEA